MSETAACGRGRRPADARRGGRLTATATRPAHGFTYESTLAASERIHWRVEDLIGGDKRLDFTRPFLPESLARTEPLVFLSPAERRVLNQIRAHGYLYTFVVVEEFILPFLLDHARPQLTGDDYRVRSLLQFASEEAKHIHLFKRFREEFHKGFGTRCRVIGRPEAVAEFVLAHEPLAVALAILQIEWMTQAHYLDSVQDDGGLDPQFKSLLKHHWMDEAQHAKLDTLMVEALADGRGEAERLHAVEGYLDILGFVDDGLARQVEFDRQALEAATGRVLDAGERDVFTAVQLQAHRWTFLGSGMVHRNVLATLERLSPAARRRVEDVSPAFC